jgi:hypothetical protein
MNGAPKRRIPKEALLLAAGLIAGGALVEVLSRAYVHATTPKSGYSPLRGRRSHEPLNTAGYRDFEHSKRKPAGVKRAVFVGDSFTFGVGVLLDDTYPKRVERTLSADRSEKWESVVFATPGAGTSQEAGVIESEAFAYEPDLLVLGYVLNDAEEPDSAERRRAQEWTEHREARRHPPFWRHSAFLSLAADRIHATIENRERVRNQTDLYRDGAPGFTAVRSSIERIAKMARERGVPFVVAVFPLFANSLGADYPFAMVHAKVDDLCRRAGADVVDLLPYYRDLDWRLLVVEGALDEHPNELAHRIAAQALVAHIEEKLLSPNAHRISTRAAAAPAY